MTSSLTPESMRQKAIRTGIPLSPLDQLYVSFQRRLKRLNADDRLVLEKAMHLAYERSRKKILEGER